jgi:small subunit ribosomal protein S6
MNLQEYECMMVIHPGASAPEAEAIIARFENSVRNHGGAVTRRDDWGVRKLEYEIEKQTNGHFWLFGFTADNSLVSEADRDMRLDDKVIRHLIVRDERWAERNRAAQSKRRPVAVEQEEDDGDGA